MDIRFRLLGETAVARDGSPLAIGARMQRALLALLAVDAGHVVSVDRLIDSLWGDDPPSASTATLHAYISQVRKLLEPDRPARAPATVLITRDPGYLLAVDGDSVDALRFERLARSGRSALEHGDPAEANRLLGEAMELWQGPPLAEFASEGWALPIIARLTEAYATAAEDRADAWMALGRHVAAVSELDRMVADAPLRERRWAQLILALYRSRRQADALRAYQRCRAVLADELGIDPGPELRALEQAVLAQDSSLELSAAPLRVVATNEDETHSSSAASADPIVARAAYLARATERLGALKTRGGALLLVGEPGIGKTTLAEAAVTLAGRSAITTAWSRCPDAATSPAYWPWVQLLRALEPTAAITLALETLAGGHGVAEAEEIARFDCYRAVLEALVSAAPLVAVIDDLHAADDSSLAVLRLLAGDLHRLPVLLVVTARSTEGSPALDETIAELVRQRGVERLAVNGLSVTEVIEFAQRATGSELSSNLASALHDRTGGNPFYLGEMLRLLGSEHRGRPLVSADVTALDVPAGVRDVVIRRVGRLPADTQAMLTLAAVAGRDVDLDVLEQAAGVDSAQLMLALEPAVAAGLLVERGDVWGYRFTHALISDSLVVRLSRLERGRLHARIGDALENVAATDPARAAEIAHHLTQAGPLGDATRAVAWSRRAADQAEQQSAWSEVAVHLEQALAVIDAKVDGGDRIRCDLLAQLGRARRMTGDVSSARGAHLDDAIRIAAAIGDETRTVSAAVVFGTPSLWSWRSPGEYDPIVIGALEGALDTVDDPAYQARILGTLGMELYYTNRRADADAYADRAVALARSVGDPELLGRVLNNALLTNWLPGRDAKARAVTEEALGWAGRGLPRVLEIMARMHRMAPLIRSGELVEFDVELARCRDMLAELRMVKVELEAQVDFWECCRQLLEGRLHESRQVLERAVDLQRRTSVWGAEFNLMVGEIGLRRAQGGIGDLADTLVPWAHDPEGQMLRPAALLALSDAGRHDEAQRLVASWWAPVRYDWAWYWLFPLWAEVAASLGTPDPHWAYDELLPHADRLAIGGTGMVAAGSMHIVLAVLAEAIGDRDGAVAHARRAVARERGLGLRGFEPRSAAILARLQGA